MLADDRYDAVAIELRDVARARDELATINMRDHPEVIYAHSYQDGLLHAFERVLARFKTGEYSDPTRIEALIGAYEPIREAKMREGAYWDVAYINGYTNALAWLVSPEEDRAGLPMFFVFGEEALFTFEQYKVRHLRPSGCTSPPTAWPADLPRAIRTEPRRFITRPGLAEGAAAGVRLAVRCAVCCRVELTSRSHESEITLIPRVALERCGPVGRVESDSCLTRLAGGSPNRVGSAHCAVWSIALTANGAAAVATACARLMTSRSGRWIHSMSSAAVSGLTTLPRISPATR